MVNNQKGLVDTFSYKQYFHGNTLMVIIPHEDDELNVAGATIYGAKKEGLRVICVFVTNGDFDYLPTVRIQEAIKALQVLNVPAEDIIFLGYPDGGIQAEHSVFMHGQKNAIIVNGNNKTRGSETISEFCMIQDGVHNTNTWNNLLSDLKNVILTYKPSGIIAVDLDSHPDHRMVSLAVEKVMGDILNVNTNAYHPVVLKGFAYNTGFESKQDFYSKNLLSTVFNKKHPYFSFETDNPSYKWEDRIRFPVPEECRMPLLWDNIIFQAARCHLSQRAFLRADRIINGDQVFWLRRTDNLVYEGTIEVSSGCGKYLHDFQIISMLNIYTGEKIYPEACTWIPDKGDSQKFCQCTFSKKKHIESVSLYGNPDNRGRVTKGRLIFSTGYTCEVNGLREYGRETVIEFPVQDEVSWIRFQMLETEGDDAGVSEWEIFEQKKPFGKILHILINGNFAYQWYIDKSEIKPQIGIYALGIKKEIKWFWDGTPCTMMQIQNKLEWGIGEHLIRVEGDGMTQEIKFVSRSYRKYLWYRGWQLIDRIHLWMEKQKIKPAHHRLKMLGKG